MGAGRFLTEFFSLILTAGAALLLFFMILGGSRDSFPLNTFYFLEADTSLISGAPAMARWTFWGICSVSASAKNFACTSNKAAFPFDPVSNFGTIMNIPPSFIDNSSTHFYLTRFAFCFSLISLFFTVCTLFVGFLSLFSRLAAGISSFTNGLALLFSAAMASLLTANYVMAVNGFHDVDLEAKLGVKMMGFMWAIVAIHLISEFGYGLGCCLNKGRGNKSSDNSNDDQDVRILRTDNANLSGTGRDDSSFTRTTSIRTPGPNGQGFFKSVRNERKTQEDEAYTEY
ncbi:SUR7-domain-containing protein [Nadsonia fulvescens var. elongata DSM 6958]|uniref:SUR7-domain-containing protein n=1 Tax=Nadsonia fulvescens var. elongata DSM 6958 TaxID=857566 RepID=A0A1E3PI66_9ASCO|nr:SUR7-domain-containing protein [Nadsonia fulvescens var. elongata DSM 6958]